MANKRNKQKAKLGRKPHVPQQRSNDTYNTPYGSFLPFLQINGKKQTTVKPDALLLRNWSRNNAIVRRCINIIKDKLVRQPYEFVSKTTDDNEELISILTKVLEKPNNEDNRRTFKSSIYEDLVSGDCGCFEVATTGNPYRPLFLFPVDGFSVEFVLDHKTFKYAQRVTDSATMVPMDYQYFTDKELVYLKKQSFTNNPFGLSPIESAFEYIKALTQTFNYSADIASNALPKYMANIKGLQGDQLNAYRTYFVSECMGTPNLPLVSAEDIESAQISPISEEATFKGYQEFVIGIIAITFGIPAEKLSIAKSNDRSTISEINENLLQDCIKPYGDVFEEAVNRTIDILGYSDKVLFRYVWEETLEQKKTKQTMLLELYQKDAITRNELRKALGFPEATDEFSDDFITTAKAKVNEKYGINGFGEAKQNNTSGEGGENN